MSLDRACQVLKLCLKKESSVNFDYSTTIGSNEILYPYVMTDLFYNKSEVPYGFQKVRFCLIFPIYAYQGVNDRSN